MTHEDKISFNKFHDEIERQDNNSFMGRPSNAISQPDSRHVTPDKMHKLSSSKGRQKVDLKLSQSMVE